RARYSHGIGGGERSSGRHGVDAPATEAARARHAACRRDQSLTGKRPMSQKLLGIDVGGSFIKAGVVDVAAERLVGEIISAPTPQPSSPEAMMPTIAALAAKLPEATGRVGLAFPAVIRGGRARTAANIDHAWIGADGAALIRRTLDRDALFPNTELGHMELNGMDSEKYASAHIKAMLNLDWRAWMDRVNVYLDRMQALFWPDLFILGGAISERFADFAPLLHCEAEVRPAHFGNQAGVLGAALAAAEADV